MERLRISVPAAGATIRDQIDAKSRGLARAADIAAGCLDPWAEPGRA